MKNGTSIYSKNIIKRENKIIEHIKRNLKTYLYVIIFFITGFCIGVFILNNLGEAQKISISKYIADSIKVLKNKTNMDNYSLFKQSITKSIVIIALVWTLGITFLGRVLLFSFTLLLGICLGYSTSAIMTVLDVTKGIIFIIIYLLPSNVVLIPTFFYVIVQGINCHKHIYIEQSRDINTAIIKYSYCVFLSLLPLFISSTIEAFISYNILQNFTKYL